MLTLTTARKIAYVCSFATLVSWATICVVGYDPDTFLISSLIAALGIIMLLCMTLLQDKIESDHPRNQINTYLAISLFTGTSVLVHMAMLAAKNDLYRKILHSS